MPSSTPRMARFVDSAHSAPAASILALSVPVTLLENSPAPAVALSLVMRRTGPSRMAIWTWTTTRPTTPSARNAHAYGCATYERNQMRLALPLDVSRRRRADRRATKRKREGCADALRNERRLVVESVSCAVAAVAALGSAAPAAPTRSRSHASRAAKTPPRKARYRYRSHSALAAMKRTMARTTRPIAIFTNLPRPSPTSSTQDVSRSWQSSTVCRAGTGRSSTSMLELDRVRLICARIASIGVEMSESRPERNSSRVGIDELRSVRALMSVSGSVTFSRAESSGMSMVGTSMSTLCGRRRA